MHAARDVIPAIVALVLTAHLASAQQRPPQPADPFVGTWVLNLEKSTFENQPKPKSVLRTFDYEPNGMILVTAHTENATGAKSFTHYLFKADGKEYQEGSRAANERTPTFISATKAGYRTLKLVFKNGGRVTIQHEWTVSDDGKTLTMKRTATPAQGPQAYSVQVYDKQ